MGHLELLEIVGVGFFLGRLTLAFPCPRRSWNSSKTNSNSTGERGAVVELK